MSDTITVARNFDQGEVSDFPRDQLPTGSAYRLIDYIPKLGSPLHKRGGWKYASMDLSSLSSCSRVEAVGWAPFPGDGHLIAVSDNSKLFSVRLFDGGNHNLIPNPSFESGIVGWTANNSGVISQETADARFGTKSLKCVTTALGDGFYVGTGSPTNFPVVAGTSWTLSASMKIPAGSSVNMRIDWYTGPGTGYLGSSTAACAGTGAWQFYVGSAAAPATAAYAELIWATASGPAAITYRLDGGFFEPGTTPTNYIEGGEALRGTLVSTAAVVSPSHNPFWHRDRMILPSNLLGSAANPKKYYDSGSGVYAVADIGGNPPQACVGASFGDYLILGNGWISGARYAQRIWFSAVGNSESWTPTTSFWDFPEEVVAIVPKSNLIMVLGYTGVHELAGSTPPPGGDMTLRRYVFNQGTFDSRSVVQYRDSVIWANNNGVWKSDGTTLSDLTEQGGISQLWRSLVASFNYTNGWKAAAGVFHGEYHITIFDNTGAVVISLVCNLAQTTWREETNIRAMQFATRPASPGTASEVGSEEMFTAFRGGPRVGKLSPIFTPTVAASDADGTAVLPVLETPFYKMGSTADKRFRSLLLNYTMYGGGSLRVDFVGTPEASAYTFLGNLGQRATEDRKPRLRIAKKLTGIGFRIAQTESSTDTRLHEIELEGHPFGGTR